MEVHNEDEVQDDARGENTNGTNLDGEVVSVWLQRVDELIQTCSHFNGAEEGNKAAVYQ